MKTTLTPTELKAKLVNDPGAWVEFTNENGDLLGLFFGHNGNICIMQNAKVVSSLKTWNAVLKQLKKKGNNFKLFE